MNDLFEIDWNEFIDKPAANLPLLNSVIDNTFDIQIEGSDNIFISSPIHSSTTTLNIHENIYSKQFTTSSL